MDVSDASSELLEDFQRAVGFIDFSRQVTLSTDHQLDGDDKLFENLQTCIDAVNLIEPEQEKIRILWDAATDPIERDARAYQCDLVRLQIERAAEVAKQRVLHLEQIKTKAQYQAEEEICAGGVEGTLYWFKMYAWGFDPREDSPLHLMPFFPFGFQERYIRWIERTVFELRSSGLTEKCRDAGATVGFVDWCVKQWKFRDSFSALLTSATEDLVDSKKDPDTLFEKVRFQIRMMPKWMLPKGFNLERDMPYMNIVNPDNDASIAGQAPTQNVGRQRRRTVVLGDEYASYPFGGYPQHTSLSQTTKSFFKVSSVKGKFNKFSDERHSGRANVFIMDWHDHPWKDERWYAALPYGFVGPTMSNEDIAQEIDRDYSASQPGRAIPKWSEVYNVITRSEFARVFKKRDIPTNWALARSQDVGDSPGHPNVTSWSAKPRKTDRYNDTIVFYREFVPPTEWSITEIGEGIWDKDGRLVEEGIWQLETPLKEKGRIKISIISHEASSEQKTYMKDCKRYPLQFAKVQHKEVNTGIAEFKALVNPLPEPNPFVIDPRTQDPEGSIYVAEHECEVCDSRHDGEHIIGRSRLVLLVDDEEGKLFEEEGKLKRQPAKTARGMKQARMEVPGLHYPSTEKDKPVAVRKIFKRDDDWFDTARWVCKLWGPPAVDKTPEEKYEDELPENLRMPTLSRPENDEEALHLSELEREALAKRMVTRTVYAAAKGIKLKSNKATHWRKKKR